jgi:hypothetical protein
MQSSQKSAQTKDKVAISLKYISEEIQNIFLIKKKKRKRKFLKISIFSYRKDRHLRSSEHLFLDKITDSKDTQHLESSLKEGKSKTAYRRNEKKCLLDSNSSSVKDKNEVTNSGIIILIILTFTVKPIK